MIAPLLALAAFAPAAPQATPEVSQAEFVEWVQEAARPVAHLDWRRGDAVDFSFLDQALEGKRIVYLGETDHWVAQRMEFRLLLIQELRQRGFHRIGMEMGLADGKRMDRYLETGDEAWLDRVALYGCEENLRQDRDDHVPGWTDAGGELIDRALAEARWFLTELRAMNEQLAPGEPRLRWFGYDLSFRPGGGYEDARELLAPHRGERLVQLILRQMELVPGETRLEEAARIERVVGVIDLGKAPLTELLGPAGALELRRSLQRMADAFRFIDGLQDLGDGYDPVQVKAALSARERRMAHNFDEHLAEWPADEKLILLGHALHLAQDSTNVHDDNFITLWEAIGTSLAKKLPGEVYGIWAMHRRGEHGAPQAVPPIRHLNAPPGAVEHLLAEAGPLFLLPLGGGDPRETWLSQERKFTFHGTEGRAVLPDQVNCLFFLEVTTLPGDRPAGGGSPDPVK